MAAWALRCAEVLIGAFFLGFGVANVRSRSVLIELLRTRQIPLPLLLFWAGVATQSICGALLIVGYLPALMAAVLIPFTLIAPLIFHPFWMMEGEARLLNRIIFISDYTCVIAALLLVASSDPHSFKALLFLA